MKTILVLIATVMMAGAESLYVTPSGAGATNGSSWANAFAGFGDVVWGGGAGQVGAGDTLFVGAGTYPNVSLSGKAGSAGSPITIRAAQDTNTGAVTFSGTFNVQSTQYLILDGNFGGARNFNFTGSVEGRDSIHNEFGFFNITAPATTQDHAYEANQRNPVMAYDQSLMHDGTVTVPGLAGNHSGMDGLQLGVGYTLRNIVFKATTGGNPGSTQHQDLIQCQLGYRPYIKVIGCEFIDGGDSQFDFDNNGNNYVSNIRIYNCIFRNTIDEMGSSTVRFYSNTPNAITSVDDVHIDNNTFVDSAIRNSYGAALWFFGWVAKPSVTNCSIRNNIFFNCGHAWDVFRNDAGISQSGWVFTNNLVNAGIEGNTRFGGWIQTSGAQSEAPSFVSYTPYAMNNNYRLSAADTSAREKGISLSSWFTEDKDGNSRSQGSAWDIGAYEYAGGATPTQAPTLAPTSLGMAFEAEQGSISSPFTVFNGSVSQSIETGLSAGGRAVYVFSVPTSGDYVVSAILRAPSDDQNSLYLNIDGVLADPAMIWDIPVTSGFESRTASWRGSGTWQANEFVPKVFSLAAGEHTLTIVGREAGVSIDKIAILSLPSKPTNLRLIPGS